MIYGSTMVYALGRSLGHEEAIREVRQHVVWAKERGPLHPLFPCAHVLSALRELDDVGHHIDAGATCIAKARSRAMHGALQSGADVWVSVDDDVMADLETLRALVETVRETRGVCVAPCLLRRADRDVVNVHLRGQGPEFSGMPRAPISWGGFGLFAAHREALHLAAAFSANFRDVDGALKAAPFMERLDPRTGEWLGEDRVFCEVARRARVALDVLLTGTTNHAGRVLACRATLTMDRFDTPGLSLTLGA
jgi:hypothetical protein